MRDQYESSLIKKLLYVLKLETELLPNKNDIVNRKKNIPKRSQ